MFGKYVSVLKSIKDSLKEVKLYKQNKKRLITWDEFMKGKKKVKK